MSETKKLSDWTIIKSKIFTPRQNFYGLSVVFFDNSSNLVDNLNLVFSIYSETHDIQLTSSWAEFEKTIQDMIFSGNLSQAITLTVADKLKNDTRTNLFGSELRDSILKKNIAGINTLFKHTLAKILNDEGLEIQTSIELISSDQLAKGRIREEAAPVSVSELDASLNTVPNFKLIHAKLILAPIDGKLISALAIGETLMLTLMPNSMAENAIIDRLKLRKPDGTAKPVPAKLVKIQPLGKGYQLLLNVIDNFFVKIVEEERVMVKMAAAAPTTASSTNTNPAKQPIKAKAVNKKPEASGVSWITMAAIVFLGMVIVYFVFVGI